MITVEIRTESIQLKCGCCWDERPRAILYHRMAPDQVCAKVYPGFKLVVDYQATQSLVPNISEATLYRLAPVSGRGPSAEVTTLFFALEV